MNDWRVEMALGIERMINNCPEINRVTAIQLRLKREYQLPKEYGTYLLKVAEDRKAYLREKA